MRTRLALPRLVLADLDGTLVDTLPDIAFCIDGMLTSLGLPAAGQECVRQWVGNGIEALVRRALGGDCDAGRYTQALALFTQLYGQHTSEMSRIYDGVLTGLDFLHSSGVELACVTNKASTFTHKLLEKLNLDEHFLLVISGDTLSRRKPDPLPLLHAARHFGVTPEETLIVGDSANDVEAARAAGMHVVCVSYGYNHGNDIRASQPDALIDSLAELPDMFVLSHQASNAS